MEKIIEKAGVLIEALPYIRQFYGKTFVIKLGGSSMEDPVAKRKTAEDVVLMKYVGINPIIVHGGGPDISRTIKKLGKEPVFHSGHRVTDDETMGIVEMVLVGKVNQEIVSLIGEAGGKAIGISGKDAGLIKATKYQPRGKDGKRVDIGRVGQVERIEPRVLEVLDGSGYIPVIAPIGTDDMGGTWNINADSVAGAIAAALQAEKLILLTDTPGVLMRPDDDSTLLSHVNLIEINQLMKKTVIDGGMIPKVEACAVALRGGVGKAHIIDGRVTHALLLEIFTDKGIGTLVTKDNKDKTNRRKK